MADFIVQNEAGKKFKVQAKAGVSEAHVLSQASADLGFPVTLFKESAKAVESGVRSEEERRARVRAEEERSRAEARVERLEAECERLRVKGDKAQQRADAADAAQSKVNLLRVSAVESLKTERAALAGVRSELEVARKAIETLEARVTALLADGKKEPAVRAPWAGEVEVETHADGRLKKLRFEPK